MKSKMHCDTERAGRLSASHEAKAYLYILLIMKLLDEKKVEDAREFADFVREAISDINLRTLDNFTAKIYYYTGLIYEK